MIRSITPWPTVLDRGSGSILIVWLAGALSSFAMPAVPQARWNPVSQRLPVVDGRDIRFARISTADGLSQTRVAQITQDNRGFIWFGTQYGLNRYDGYKFRVFAHDPQQPNSLGGTWIYALFKDRSGILWIGCDQSLDRLDPVTEQFTHYRMESGDPDGSPGPVIHLSQDRSGMLWLATGTGLRRLDPRTGQIKTYRHDPGNPYSLSSNDVRWTGEDATGALWVGTNNGLDAFDREAGKVTFHIPLEDAKQISFYEDRFGVFWVLSDRGLAVFDRKANLLTRYEGEPPAAALTGVIGMVEDRDGNLWLGSLGVGLLRYDRNGQRFVRYRNNPGDPESVAEDKVICLFEDREGNIWTGLHSKAPNHFNPRPPLFEKFRHEPGNPNSLDMDFVNAIYKDHEGTVWIGNDNALVRVDRKTGHYASFTAGLGNRPMVINVIEDHSGALWLGTSGHGLTRFDWRSGQFENYRHNPADPSSLSNDQVHRLFIDHAGTLWAPTDDGLDRFDPSTGTFKVYRADWKNRGTQSYISLGEDEAGALWLCTRNAGLQRFDPETERFTVLKANPADSRSLRDNMVSGVQTDGSSGLWVSTFSGLQRLDRSTGKFIGYDERDGLSGNAISCMLKDSHGDLWMSTNRGISSFHPQTRTFKNYSTADGLPGDDLTGWEACFKSPDGEMFFGGFSGAVAFRPENLRESLYAPAISLTELHVSGSVVGVGGDSPLRRSISYTDRLSLTHEQSTFSLIFSALSYQSPEVNRYRYKLEPLDKAWRQVGSHDRPAAYTTLPAGRYTFRAQAATQRGLWGEPGLALPIEILPRPWETAWFRIAGSGFLGISLWALYRARVSQIARNYTMRLDERIGERNRIARELHDTLLQGFQGLVLHFQAVLDQIPDREPAHQTMKKALSQADQVLIEGRVRVRDLRAEGAKANELSQELASYGEEWAKDRAIAFKVTLAGSPQSLHSVVREEIYRIAREALANAFQHSGASSIEVEIAYNPASFCLRVRDNGSGIDQEILGRGRKGHWGLSGMRERAQNIGGQLSIWSNPGAGTEIDLKVPTKVAYAVSSKRSPWNWIKRGVKGVS